MPSDKSQTLVVIPEKLEGVPDLGIMTPNCPYPDNHLHTKYSTIQSNQINVYYTG